MVKKIFFLMSIFAIFFFVSSPANAQLVDTNDDYGATCTLRKCEIPTPTLIAPDKASFSGKNDIYLTGLTWNNTKIQVYLDAKYQGEAIVQKNDSGIGNFYYKISPNKLDRGNHKWAVIARGAYSRSSVSKENRLEITSEIDKSQPLRIEDSGLKQTDEVIDISENTSSTTSSVDVIIESVSTSTESAEIGKETVSPNQISTSTEIILELDLESENSASTTEVLIKEPVVNPIEEQIEAVKNIEIKEQVPVESTNNDNSEKISSIKENEDGVVISAVESSREVSVYEKSESDVSVNVAENGEGKSLVVDNNYKPSENQTNIEKDNIEIGIAEKLQNAKPGDVLLNKIKQELGFNSEIEKQKKNRIIGIAILSFVIALYVAVIIRRKK